MTQPRARKDPPPRIATDTTIDWRQVTTGDHLVVYYNEDPFLLDSVTAYVAAGLQAGEAAVVVMTGRHLAMLAERLAVEGLNADALQASGRYVALDAEETLAGFMVNNTPDWERFERLVDGALSAARHAGGSVRVFGEMVALLWERGNREGALTLEEFWNRLAEAQPFALLCAYPMSAFAGAEQGDGFDRVCKCHTGVVPAESYPLRSSEADRLREIASLQQKAAALEQELAARRAAEAALRDRERELAEFLENAMEGVHRVGPDGTILWANRAELELLGFEASEYVGHHIAEFHIDRGVIDDILARLGRGESIYNQAARLRARDGSIKHVLIHSNGHWENGELRYTRCFTRDVTQNEAAWEAQARLAAIVSSSQDAIVGKDLDGTITTWNAGAERLFGYTASEVVGNPVMMLIPPELANDETIILGHIRRGERVESFETRRRRKDGTLVDVSLTVSPILDGQGRIIGASKIARDITEQKRAQQERDTLVTREKVAHQELELAYQDLKDFAFIVSHDLREPLRGIANYAAFLREDHAETIGPEGAGKLDVISRLVRRSYDLLDAVMTIARVGRDALNVEEVGAATLMGQAIENLRGRIDADGALVTYEPTSLEVRCDRKLVVQALVNLISNGLKYNRSTPKRVRLGCSLESGRPTFFVRDNGIGIDPRFHERIFHMFKRLNPAQAYGEGTGAGLAIVQKIVIRHGGRVWLASRPGEGSTFYFSLEGTPPPRSFVGHQPAPSVVDEPEGS